MSLINSVRSWLQDHNPFEDRSIRSARRRLRESNAAYGEGRPEIRRIFGPDGKPELTSTIKPYAETIEEVFESTLAEIRAAAAELPYLMQAFLGRSIEPWALEDLDHTFSAWQRSPDKGRFTDEAVVQITGAAYGEYCNRHLKTRWLLITDPVGRQLAIRSANNRVTGWPYSTVRKRIAAGEHQFFAQVYELLRRSVEETDAD